MKTRIIVAGLALLVACFGTAPTAEDAAKLQLLRENYAGTYAFDFRGDGCLAMTSARSDTVTREEGERIFSEFFLNGPTPRGDTRFAFLNTYGRGGQFQFRMYWNPRAGRLETNNVESY